MRVHGQAIFFAVVVATILCPIADAQACSGWVVGGGLWGTAAASAGPTLAALAATR